MIDTARITIKGPGAGSSVGGGAQAPWTNPSNITADDGSSASLAFSLGGQSGEDLTGDDFGFNIPNDAVIDGVVVIVDGSNSGCVGNIRLYTTGGFGFKDASSLATTYGDLDDTWGVDLTPALINASTFAISVLLSDESGGDGTATVDYIEVSVHWHYDVAVDPVDVPLRHDYKIYSPNKQFLGMLPNVTNEFAILESINSGGCQLGLDIADSIDGGEPVIGLGTLTQWLPGGWNYRQKITIPRSSVTGDLVDFPVYIDLSHMGQLFFAAVDSNGADIRITDAYGLSELPFEIVSINTTTKTGELWFKANVLSTEYDNNFYIYYGNIGASAYAATDLYGANNVWTDYEGVYHLNDASDSTVNGADGTAVGSPTFNSGKLGDALTLVAASSQYIDIGGSVGTMDTLMAGKSTWSISFWIKKDVMGAVAMAFGVNKSDLTNILLGIFAASTNDMKLAVAAGTVGTLTTGDISDEEWHLVTISKTGTTVTLLTDGVSKGSQSSVTITFASGNHWTIGAERDPGPSINDFLDGEIDEFRVRDAVISTAWHAAEYANQNDPSTFYTVGDYQEEYIEAQNVLIKNGNLIVAQETSYYYPNGRTAFKGQINRIEAGTSGGTVKILCHNDGRDLDNMAARGGPFSYTNDQSQTTADAYHTVSQNVNGQWNRVAQLWTVGGGITNLGRILLRLLGNATVTVTIRKGLTGEVLGSVTQAVNVGVATNISFILDDFIDITPGAQYSVAVSVAAGQSIRVYYKNNTNPYASGSMYTASFAGGSGGGSWAISTNDDLYFTTAYGTNSTEAEYTDNDPTGDILPAIMDDYILRGGAIGYSSENIDPTGLSLSASFNTNTIFEALQKIIEMSPSGFYFYVDPGENELYAKDTSRTADYILVKGRHIEDLSLVFSIENVVNDILFSGGDTGSGDNLYSQYTDAVSKSLYGTRLDRKSDNRVKVQTTADAIGTSGLNRSKGEQYFTEVTVLAKTMDITLLKPGKTIGFRGYGNFIDSMLMQITSRYYTARRVQLTVGTTPIRFNSQIEKVIRGLIAEQTINNPATPT